MTIIRADVLSHRRRGPFFKKKRRQIVFKPIDLANKN